MLITKPYLGWIPGGAITAFSSWANYEANAAYYLRETRSISASCSPTVKKGIRYTVTTVFSLSSALLYVLALADVRGHLNGSDKSCFDTPDTLDAVTIAGCAISLLTISLATFDRYNTDMARRLDEESCNLPKLLDVLCKAKAIAIFAALCKTVISAFSAYELFNAYNSPLALTLSLVALSALANIMVQYGIFGQPDQLSTVDIPLLGEQEQNPTPRPSSAGSQKSDDPGPLPTAFAPSHRSHRGNWCARFFSWCCSNSEETPDKARQAKHLSLA